MSEATSQTLLRAYELIEADDHEQARDLLEPVLAVDPDNADAWWLYAHAVATPGEAQDAISNLMRIDPNYPGAAELNTKIRRELPETQRVFVPQEEYETAVVHEVDAAFGRFVRWLVLVAAVAGVLLVAYVLLSGRGENADQDVIEQPTSVVSGPTLAIVTPADDVTAEVQNSSTDEVRDDSQIDDAVTDSVLTAFSTFELASESTTVVNDVVGGQTLLIGVCGNDAPLELIDLAMQNVASISTGIDSVDALGIRIYDCVSGDVINSLAVDLDVAQQFGNGTIDLRTYQSQWRVVLG